MPVSNLHSTLEVHQMKSGILPIMSHVMEYSMNNCVDNYLNAHFGGNSCCIELTTKQSEPYHYSIQTKHLVVKLMTRCIVFHALLGYIIDIWSHFDRSSILQL